MAQGDKPKFIIYHLRQGAPSTRIGALFATKKEGFYTGRANYIPAELFATGEFNLAIGTYEPKDEDDQA